MSELSKYGQLDFPSRISARGVVFGATISLVSSSVLMALGGGLGIIPSGPFVDASALREAAAGLAVWGTISWTGATFIGALISAMNAKATSRADGLLHGIATWAIAGVAGGILSTAWLMSAVSLDLVARDITSVFMTRGAMWTYFTADLLALASALLGGNVAFRMTSKLSGRLEVRREEAPPVARRPAPMPT